MNIQLQTRRAHGPRRSGRDGFTLVEMLVATGLVVLIMSLFAQIYATAIGSITEQRGMGNNDQKARILTRLLHNDLSNMSYKQADAQYCGTVGIVPITPGDEGGAIDILNQSGYFYLSENDPYNPVDDVLQFTAEVKDPSEDNVYTGRLTNIINPSSYNQSDFDEPATDISAAQRPGYGKSKLAEIAYFVRGGTLYRRTLLIRESGGRENLQPAIQNRQIYGQETIPNAPENYRGTGPETYYLPDEYPDDFPGQKNFNFWKDFDYSATRRSYTPPSATPSSYLWFHTKLSLMNTIADDKHLPLGQPWNRFGHLNSPGQANHGHPREYLNQTGDLFLGRLTQQEISSRNTLYPGQNIPGVFDRNNTAGFTDDDSDGIIDQLYNDQLHDSLYGGNTIAKRTGEDIVLTNVESFDIEVWEPSSNNFAQLGNMNGGTFAANSLPIQDSDYGPRFSGNNIFDTWHPQALYGNATTPRRPPFRPMNPDRPVLIDVNMAGNAWQPDHNYSVGDQIRVNQLSNTDNSIYSNSWVYEVVALTDAGPGKSSMAMNPPSFQPQPGSRFLDNNLVWECVDKRIGLRAIRITIRYIDQQTRIPRQVTVVHSFTR